jgi:hypothetical protein
MKNIFGVQLFVKLSLCCLEHLRNRNRLKSKVGGYEPINIYTLSLDKNSVFRQRTLYRLYINYRSILQNHIVTNTEQKYMMLLPFE